MSYKTTNDLMQHLRDNSSLSHPDIIMAIKAIVSSNLPVRACLFPLIKSSMPPSNMILP